MVYSNADTEDNVFLAFIKSIKNGLKDVSRFRWDKFNHRFIKFYNDQTFNDRWVLDMLNGKEHGFFIEAGAADGIRGSSTLCLEKYFGWKGILIEPGPGFWHLQKNRVDCMCLNKILSSRPGRHPFHFFPEKEDYSCTDIGLEEHKAKIKKAHLGSRISEKKLFVESITLEETLIKYCKTKRVDFLSLDIEGSEYDALKKFPFKKYDIMCISVEGDKCDRLLLSNGYLKVKNKYNNGAPWESNFIKK